MGIVNRDLKLGNRERLIRTCLNLDIDRQPFCTMFGPWVETAERWRSEGCPDGNWIPPCGFDVGFVNLPVNLGFYPGFERVVLQEDNDNRTIRDEFGVTFIEKKANTTIPRYIDYPVKDRDDWVKLRNERLDPNLEERFPSNWKDILSNVHDAAIQVGRYPFGLFGTLREFMGVEELLMAFCEEPELIHEMMDYLTDFWIAIYERVLKDVQIDHIHMWEDMSGKQGPLISPAMFREFLMPNYQRIAAFAKKNDIAVFSIDTDGNMDILMPLLKESGFNLILPFEVQAGCDVVELKKQYPDLCLYGGIDKRALAISKEEIDRELDRIDELYDISGYIPALDHLIHPEISYQNFMYFVERLKRKVFGL